MQNNSVDIQHSQDMIAFSCSLFLCSNSQISTDHLLSWHLVQLSFSICNCFDDLPSKSRFLSCHTNSASFPSLTSLTFVPAIPIIVVPLTITTAPGLPFIIPTVAAGAFWTWCRFMLSAAYISPAKDSFMADICEIEQRIRGRRLCPNQSPGRQGWFAQID